MPTHEFERCDCAEALRRHCADHGAYDVEQPAPSLPAMRQLRHPAAGLGFQLQEGARY
jgi:hypothetical protein